MGQGRGRRDARKRYGIPNGSRLRVTVRCHFQCVPIPLADADIPERSAPHVVATFDIETFSSRSTRDNNIFPDATVNEDVVTMIVTYFNQFGETTPYDALALVLIGPGGVAPKVKTVQSATVTVRVLYFKREAELLRAWVASYADARVTVWSHFNGLGFDEPYLYHRCNIIYQQCQHGAHVLFDL